MRINKYLAQAGVCSRRKADLLIEAGRVALNGVPVRKLGIPVDENTDVVTVDGKKVSLRKDLKYILLNKPKGCLSTVRDNFRRPTVLDLVGRDKKVYPVGRLDQDSRGVLLLTNDGELAYRLTHPKFEIEKTYLVTVKGKLNPDVFKTFEQGIKLDDGAVGRGEGRMISSDEQASVFELKLKEGRKREIKRMCHQVGLKVTDLVRTSFAHLTARGLDEGQWRYLEENEIERLRTLAGI